MNRYTFLAWACLSLAACQNEPSAAVATASSAASDSQVQAKVASFSEAKPSDVYQQYAWLNRKATAQLSHAQADEANRLYDVYRQESDEILQQINNQETDFLQNYSSDEYWTINEASGVAVATPIMQQKQDELAKVGLRLVDVGEGMGEIMPAENTETKLFAAKVSADYREFIEQQDKESNVLAEMDAAIVIPWTELGARTAFWENFAQRYPQSKLAKEAQQRFEWYASAFLFGSDNTPVEAAPLKPEGDRQEEMARFYDEVRHAWQVYMRQYPQSRLIPAFAAAEQTAQLPANQRFDSIDALSKQYFPSLFGQKAASAAP